ncbi:MAG: hypothetical protein GTO21_01265, partial [Armatimonadetes bacterium]|nr:hypothetical protein [Armatimonadota bacterium]
MPTKKPFHFILKHIDGEMAHFLRNPSTKNVPGLALLSSKTDTTVLHIHTRKRGEAFASSEREEALISKPLFHAERPKFYCRLVDVKKLSREELFSRLPEEVKVEVLQSDFRGGYVSRMLSAKSPFLTLGGLQAGEKPFSLPLGSTVRLGFAVAEGWAEIEGEVVGWSANSNGSQMMVSC